jgi:energy-converting hydrogenase B subunit D
MSSMIVPLLTIILCLGILIGGLLAVMLDNIVAAVVSAGLSSLFASVIYVVLSAPDVAMTEASIGSGLATMIFLYAVRKTQAAQEDPEQDSTSTETTGERGE